MSKTIESVSANICPVDDRCRWWSKVIRDGADIPLPSSIEGASDIAGNFLKKGEEELSPGDIVIHGEEVHHRHNRGWTYQIGYMSNEGELEWVQPTKEHKQALKESGMETDFLKGSGELAACARLAHGLRNGLDAGIPPMATGPVEVEVAVEHAPSSASTDFLASLTPNEAGQSAEREEDNGLSQ